MVYKVKGDGSGFVVLRSFLSATDGDSPTGALVSGGDGFLYGTTSGAGPSGGGTIWKIALDGSLFTVLHSFSGSGAASGPASGLTAGGDGFFYGVTPGSGNANGMIFKIAPDGSGFTDLYDFPAVTPVGTLAVGGDGYLYGATANGSVKGWGDIYKIKADGTGYAEVYSFNDADDGSNPQAGVTVGGDGFLYGTASYDGAGLSGTAFKVKTDGTLFTVLHSFTGDPDGNQPIAPLLLGRDGFLYSTTFTGGGNDDGTVWKVATDGTGYTVLASLTGLGTDGANPQAGVTQGPDGRMYGASGGGNVSGAVFSLAGLAPVSAHMLYANALGQAQIVTAFGDGATPISQIYGPLPGWTPSSITTGPDGHVHLRWMQPGGAFQLWDIDPSGTATVGATYTPMAGWVSAGSTAGPDGHLHIAWNRPDATLTLWDISPAGAVTAQNYPTALGWTPAGFAAGPDGHLHLAWNRTDKKLTLWDISPTGTVASRSYGPFPRWTPLTLATGADNHTHLLLARGDNLLTFFDIDSSWTVQSRGFRPQAGWQVQGLAAGQTSGTRVLWNRGDGTSAFWDFPSAGHAVDLGLQGPVQAQLSALANWTPVGIAAGQ